MYGQVWVQYFCVYGLAAVTSMVVARENAALLGVIVSLIVACLCGYGPSLNQGREWALGAPMSGRPPQCRPLCCAAVCVGPGACPSPWAVMQT